MRSRFKSWKTLSATALKLLYSSSDQCGEFRLAQRREDFADDVSLYAAYDITADLALSHALCGMKPCFRMVAHPHDGNAVERGIGLPIAAPFQAHPDGLAVLGADRANAAQFCQGGF